MTTIANDKKYCDITSIIKKYFNLKYDKRRQTWMSNGMGEMNYLQTDLLIVCRTLLYKIVLTEIAHERNERGDKNIDDTLLGFTIEKSLIIDLRLLVNREAKTTKKNQPGTGGDFVGELANLLQTSYKDDQVFKNLNKKVGRFQSIKARKDLVAYEARLLHKDLCPNKRRYLKDTYGIWGGAFRKMQVYQQDGVKNTVVFGILNAYADILMELFDLFCISYRIPFIGKFELKKRIGYCLKVFNENSEELNDRIESYLRAKIPGVLELIGWI